MNSIPIKKCSAEFLGALVLTLGVSAALRLNASDAAPLIAALTVGLFVYTIGSVSGAHMNPAVTIGLLSIHKIHTKEAMWYIVSQLLGGVLALALANALIGGATNLTIVDSVEVGVAELIGAFILVFGVCSVVYKKVTPGAAGAVIGGSLFLGIVLASFTGSNGILNPAVAIGLDASSLMYMVGPLLGGIVAAHVAQYFYS